MALNNLSINNRLQIFLKLANKNDVQKLIAWSANIIAKIQMKK